MNKNQIELKLGIMTNKELANWFGISASSLSHDKARKLKQLQSYAEYELVGNKTQKVKINKIYEAKYNKKGSQSFELIKNKLNLVWSDDGLDSCKRVCYEILQTSNLTIADTTAYHYTLKSRNDLFGKPFQQAGSLGSCRYLWCKQEQETGRLCFLTQEQEKIKQGLIKKYFGDATEKQIIVQGMVEAGEISKEQAWDVLTKMTNMKGNNFLAFLKQLQKKIGCKVIRGTLVERNYLEEKESAF